MPEVHARYHRWDQIKKAGSLSESAFFCGEVCTDEVFDVALHIVYRFEVCDQLWIRVCVQIDDEPATSLCIVTLLRSVFLFDFYCFSPRFLLE